jgi:hypothetical protein
MAPTQMAPTTVQHMVGGLAAALLTSKINRLCTLTGTVPQTTHTCMLLSRAQATASTCMADRLQPVHAWLTHAETAKHQHAGNRQQHSMGRALRSALVCALAAAGSRPSLLLPVCMGQHNPRIAGAAAEASIQCT